MGWRLSSPDTWSNGEGIEKGADAQRGREADARHEIEAEGNIQDDVTPHEDEEHVHEEAEGDPEKAAEHDPVAEADEVDVETRGVDAKIKFGAAALEVEGAEITAVFPLLGLLDFMTATSPSVI